MIACLLLLALTPYTSRDHLSSKDNNVGTLSANSEFSTFLGGAGSEISTRITTDSEDNIILKLMTDSEDMPTTTNAAQTEFAGGIDDGFVAKFSPYGDLIFGTYFGGSDDDHIVRIAIDDEDNIYVVGSTHSTDFPTTYDALFHENQGNEDGFIAKLSSNGTLVYCSYFGGSGIDRIQNVMFHGDGSILVEGYTSSANLATSGAYQQSSAGSIDSFVAKLDSEMKEIQMFTYYGGSGEDYAWRVDIDSECNFIICGETRSTNIPTTSDAICRTYSGSTDGFFAKISADGGNLQYATYIGGSSVDFGGGVNVDSNDEFYITGVASSGITNLEYTEEQHHGRMDFFAAKFTADCEMIYFKMIGGNRTDLMWDAVLDNEENIVIVGSTSSDDYPIINAVQQERIGGDDACVTVLSSDGESIILSTYIGGSATEKGEGISVQSDGSLIISGYSSSDDFPTSWNAYQSDKKGSYDAILYHINPSASMTTPTSTIGNSETSLDYLAPLLGMTVGGALVVTLGMVLMKRRLQNS